MIYSVSKNLYFYLKIIILEELIVKKFSEFKKNLTSSQAACYTILTSLIIALPITVFCLILFWPSYELLSIPLSLIATAFPFGAIYLVLDNFVFKAHDKYWQEKHATAKRRVINNYGLTKGLYIKVNYNYEKMIEEVSDRKMLTELWPLNNCTFYARLTDNEKIELIAKDVNQKVVYLNTFDNFIYFETYFKV